jgi:uncharacterized protein
MRSWFDRDGRMRAASAVISKSNICPYKGSEIPDFEKLGLAPDRLYMMLRHPDEIAKAARSFAGVPILDRHVGGSAFEAKDVIGAVGSNPKFTDPYLWSDAIIWSGPAIDDIVSKKRRELSASYRYAADMRPGVWAGRAYDGVIRNIHARNVALVVEGRIGPDAALPVPRAA